MVTRFLDYARTERAERTEQTPVDVNAIVRRTVQLLRLCRELGLATTGGSDFHGPRVRAATLGQPSVPWDAWEDLRRRADR